MQLSNVQEGSVLPRKLYLGIENFQATAVNPTMKELNDMGIRAVSEPEYVVKVLRNFGDGEKEYDAVNLRIYLTNNDTTNPIRTQVNYQVVKSNHVSSTNKIKVINKYGNPTWLEATHIAAGTVPANYDWYVNEGVKECYRGEDSFVAFMKAFRNLPNINQSADADAKAKGVALINATDWDKMFRGDFKDIRDAIMGLGDKGKVGYLMGVRHLEDKDVQTIYKASPLKRFMKKVGGNEYLTKDVTEAQEAGAYSDVTFDTTSYTLREFDPTLDKVQADEPEMVYPSGDEDDLPF